MEPLPSYPIDELRKFKIKDLFPHTDDLSRYVLMVLAAKEDLSNIERFKDLLQSENSSLEKMKSHRLNRTGVNFFCI
ncbi:MAG: hypothetical protein ABI618_20855, partial [Nitrospirota bacterium]